MSVYSVRGCFVCMSVYMSLGQMGPRTMTFRETSSVYSGTVDPSTTSQHTGSATHDTVMFEFEMQLY